MFRTMKDGYVMPEPGTVEGLEVKAATRGGGYIVHMQVKGRIDTMVFPDERRLTQTLMAMLNGAAFAQMKAPSPVPAQPVVQLPVQQVSPPPASDANPKPKRKGGRPKLSEEEKAARKEARLAAKRLNGAKQTDVPAEASQEVQQAAA